jgi:hypothetical protein
VSKLAETCACILLLDRSCPVNERCERRAEGQLASRSHHTTLYARSGPCGRRLLGEGIDVVLLQASRAGTLYLIAIRETWSLLCRYWTDGQSRDWADVWMVVIVDDICIGLGGTSQLSRWGQEVGVAAAVP